MSATAVRSASPTQRVWPWVKKVSLAGLAVWAAGHLYRRELLYGLVQSVEAMIWEAQVPPWRFRFVSNGTQTMLGYPVQRWLREGPKLIRQVIHEEDYQRVMDWCRRALDGQQAHLEYRMVTASGHTIWVEGLVQSLGHKLRPSLLRGIAVDVTARRQAEEATRRQAERFRVAEEQSQDAFLIASAVRDETGKAVDLRWDYLNPVAMRMLGGQPDQLVGRTFRQTVPESATQDLLPRYLEVVETGQPHDLEISCLGPDHQCWHRSLAVRLGDGVAIRFGDITARKHLELDLKTQNRGLTLGIVQRTEESQQRAQQLQLLAVELAQAEQREQGRLAQVLHDHLQQLLVTAKLRVEMARDECPENQKDPLDKVAQLLDQSVQTVRSLTAELSPRALREQGLAAGLHWLGRHVEEQNNIPVQVQAQEIPLCEGLQVLLFQTARELLFNVVKHAQARHAQLHLERLGEQVVLSVIDDGVGMVAPPAQGAASTVGGYGLQSIRERAEMVGGQLELSSAPGQGTKVTLRLPLHPGVAAAPPPSLPPAPEPALPRAETVPPPPQPPVQLNVRQLEGRPGLITLLLAEDHRMVRQSLTLVLDSQPDMQVIAQADDGLQAVEMAQQLHPQVVLMDVSLPKLDGIAATRRIMEDVAGVCVVGLSMYQEAGLGQAMRHAGACGYVSKDMPMPALLEAIRQCAAAHMHRP